MIGDVVIILLATASGWAAYKLFTMETKHSTLAFCLGLFLISFLIGGIIAPNKELIYGVFTPPIHGQLIDSDTKQPIPNGDIAISWISHYSEFPYRNGASYPKSIAAKSDSNGSFSGPSRHKSLAVMLFPVYCRETSIAVIRVFIPDYEIGYGKINDSGKVTISMNKIRRTEQITKKHEELQWFERYGSPIEKELARLSKERKDRLYSN